MLQSRVVETLELADLEFKSSAHRHPHTAREIGTGQNMRRSLPAKNSNTPKRTNPPLAFYREKRLEIERALFIGGRGYETSREEASTICTAYTGKRLHESRDTASRLKQNYRRYARDRYRLAPSR